MSASYFLDALPDIFGRHELYPSGMIGAKIVKIGTLPSSRIEGGGLVIDYLPDEGGVTNRVI